MVSAFTIQEFRDVMTSSSSLQAEDGSWYHEETPTYAQDLEILDFYTALARGIWYGLYAGIYHEKKHLDERCLSDSIHDEIKEIMEFFAYGELNQVFKLADSVSSLYFDNKLYCGGQVLGEDLKHHCEERSCTSG